MSFYLHLIFVCLFIFKSVVLMQPQHRKCPARCISLWRSVFETGKYWILNFHKLVIRDIQGEFLYYGLSWGPEIENFWKLDLGFSKWAQTSPIGSVHQWSSLVKFEPMWSILDPVLDNTHFWARAVVEKYKNSPCILSHHFNADATHFFATVTFSFILFLICVILRLICRIEDFLILITDSAGWPFKNCIQVFSYCICFNS